MTKEFLKVRRLLFLAAPLLFAEAVHGSSFPLGGGLFGLGGSKRNMKSEGSLSSFDTAADGSGDDDDNNDKDDDDDDDLFRKLKSMNFDDDGISDISDDDDDVKSVGTTSSFKSSNSGLASLFDDDDVADNFDAFDAFDDDISIDLDDLDQASVGSLKSKSNMNFQSTSRRDLLNRSNSNSRMGSPPYVNMDKMDSSLSSLASSGGGRKECLYDAYNQLHTLAQDYNKPFDAPAVVVVGHQSSGKSALIEAIMGFQFNQVGGGTKTRRPVALRMQYNPKCDHPKWYLMEDGSGGVEKPVTLGDVQHYIERENRRLARDPVRSFDAREIHIRMEYKHCPNMILIDTPGLISAPKVPDSSKTNGSAHAQQRALQAAAREAERLVVEKIKCKDFIILCVEDTNDWKHGATREVVQKADPDLSRTVIVNTKLDTKIPQFSTPRDVEVFIRARILDRLSPHRLGGPFFTSIPSGRVGRKDDSGIGTPTSAADYLFDTDQDFVNNCDRSEEADFATISERLKKMMSKDGAMSSSLLMRIGLSKLKTFLEARVDECYRRNVAKIIPMLQTEYLAAERRLQACETELEALSVKRLKAGADAFCDEFCVCLRKAVQGSIVAPANLFGETLPQETSQSGSFHDVQGCPMAVSDRTWDRLLQTEVGGVSHRLYGGSQYHRTLREFDLATRCLRLPTTTEDEIVNAAGMGDTHDGTNFLHAACVIALEKARISFEPLLDAFQIRMNHVMNRLCPVAEYMLRESRGRGRGGAKLSTYRYSLASSLDINIDDVDRDRKHELENAMDISQNPQFRQLIRSIFERFVQNCSENAMAKCRDDMTAITSYVTWNLGQRGSSALSGALPDQTDIFGVYQVALEAAQESSQHQSSTPLPPSSSSSSTTVRGGESTKSRKRNTSKSDNKNKKGQSSDDGTVVTKASWDLHDVLQPLPTANKPEQEYRNLMALMQDAILSRDTNRTTIVVGGLVHHIVSGWREQFCRSVTTKFNCYFMLPFVEEFHRYLRRELQKVYDGDTYDGGVSGVPGDGSDESSLTDDVFDLRSARRALQLQRDQLIGECLANKALQDKFRTCSQMMRKQNEDMESTTHVNSIFQ